MDTKTKVCNCGNEGLSLQEWTKEAPQWSDSLISINERWGTPTEPLILCNDCLFDEIHK